MLNVWKPWFVYRPRQLLRRVVRGVRRTPTRPVEVATPWGIPIAVHPGETIGRSIWTTGIYDLAASEVLYRLALPGKLHADVGANIGFMTGLLAYRAGATGRVLAFEPHPAIRQQLCENIARIARHPGTAPVDLHAVALSDRDGEACLVEPAGFEANTGTARLATNADSGGMTVTTRTLDAVVGEFDIELMKIDVEGCEADVLRGAGTLLRDRRIRHILFEEHRGTDADSFRLLRNAGYALRQVGWRMSGPVVADLTAPRVCKPYEAPNYLATLDPDAVAAALRPRGWRALQGRVPAGAEVPVST